MEFYSVNDEKESEKRALALWLRHCFVCHLVHSVFILLDPCMLYALKIDCKMMACYVLVS